MTPAGFDLRETPDVSLGRPFYLPFTPPPFFFFSRWMFRFLFAFSLCLIETRFIQCQAFSFFLV